MSDTPDTPIVLDWVCLECGKQGRDVRHPLANWRSTDERLTDLEVAHALSGCNGRVALRETTTRGGKGWAG